MKKIIDLIAPSGTHKDELLLDYIQKNYLSKKFKTNLCFISGQGEEYEHHNQISPDELRELIFEENDKNTIYFLRSFFFDKDREAYLKVMEDACNCDIQIFKTDQIEEHITNDRNWTDRYCKFLTINDLKDNCLKELFKFKIYESVYHDMISKKKNIEIRLLNEKTDSIKIGDEIEFQVLDSDKKLLVEVTNKYFFNSLGDLWDHKDIVLSSAINYPKDELNNKMVEIFGEEKLKSSKIIGIEFKLL